MFRYKVDKMGCGGCAKSVTRAVQAVEPNARVEVDLDTKLVTVSGVSGSADRFAQAINAAGFPAEPARPRLQPARDEGVSPSGGPFRADPNSGILGT